MIDNRLGRVGWVLLCGLVGTIATSCDEEKNYDVAIEDAGAELGNGYCGRLFDCSCDDGRSFDSETQCRDELSAGVEQIQTVGQEEGLTYDPSCWGEVLRILDETGCETVFAVDDDGCRPPCHAYYGESDVGQPCDWLTTGVSDCAQGLQCDGATCYDPCGQSESGGQQGQICRDRGCVEGLYCDFEDDVCRPLPDVGQPCDQAPCRDGTFCDQVDPADPLTWVCAAPRENAEGCRGHTQCKSLHCPVGVCEPMPGRGDPCPANLCAPGLECEQGKCRPGEPAICWGGEQLLGGY